MFKPSESLGDSEVEPERHIVEMIHEVQAASRQGTRLAHHKEFHRRASPRLRCGGVLRDLPPDEVAKQLHAAIDALVNEILAEHGFQSK